MADVLENKEVFCNECTFFKEEDFGEGFVESGCTYVLNTIVTRTALKKEVVYEHPNFEEQNKNNDCKYYNPSAKAKAKEFMDSVKIPDINVADKAKGLLNKFRRK